MVVEMFLAINDPAGTNFFWIGMNNLNKAQTWMLEPSHQPATYFNWNEGEPNGYPTERFVHILEKANERKWNDLGETGADFPIHALCQKNM
jgi:hypothetical protein